MVGTPVITTDFGAFVETVEHGKTGFRCHTMNEFVLAAEEVKKLDPQYIRDRAVRLYSLDTIKWKYDSYFRRLLDLWGEGWSTLDGRIDEHWLQSK
jgi:glycosyltransferase involved in cell wall biosynthesis